MYHILYIDGEYVFLITLLLINLFKGYPSNMDAVLFIMIFIYAYSTVCMTFMYVS